MRLDHDHTLKSHKRCGLKTTSGPAESPKRVRMPQALGGLFEPFESLPAAKRTKEVKFNSTETSGLLSADGQV
jgi:hypothetical protein